jgi:nitric oxide reductase NorD protein
MAAAGVARWKLLASAIAGRLVDVAPVEVAGPAWTDGTTIFVDDAIVEREQLLAVTVQAALLGAGSLDADLMPALARRPAVARRYLAVEGHRALAAHATLLPPAARSLLDARTAGRSDSPVASLAIASSRDAVDDAPPCFGTIRPRRIRRTIEGTGGAAVEELRPRVEVPPGELDDSDDDRLADMSRFASPVGGGGAIGRLLKRMFRDTRSGAREAAGPPGQDAPTYRSRSNPSGARRTTWTTARADRIGGIESAERRGVEYPEWDVHGRRYRPDWCTVYEVDASGEEHEPKAAIDARALRRPLARLGLDLERRRRQLQGDDVDIDAAVEAYVEAAAGSPPDEAVYVDTVRRRRDLAVLVLLDISGSAGEPSSTGVPVHEHQRAAAAALTTTLHDLGDRVALYAFRSQGRSAVHFVRVKRFDDGLDARMLHRLDALVPGAFTRLGAAIRHGTSVLETSGGAPRRMLVVLSDGFAYDHGYEGAYGEADARRAIAEARRRGTGCLCLSIGARTDADALRRVFGTAAHATLPRGEHLAGVVGPLFRAALQSAERRQRSWQRSERTRERLQIERVVTSSTSS